jgi:two-component system, NtrC family, response regulator AtoC
MTTPGGARCYGSWVTSAGDPTRSVNLNRRSGGPRLVVLWPGGHIERDLEPGRRIVIGRGVECDVHVLDPSVSRRHLVVAAGPPVTAEDLGSGNGSRIGGRALEPGKPVPLATGDAVEFGSAVALLSGTPASSDGPRSVDPMTTVDRLLTLTAPSSISVLLVGETGVGKSRAAARIHAGSARAKGPFLQINCAAISPTLIESELFGYERGAFTGATSAKIGLLQAADGGTLFLDEVGELPLEVQAKLLQALETRQVRRVGGVATHNIDIRIVSATNRPIEEDVASGRFRSDLYFRLNGMTILLPALRERPAEVVRLAEEFAVEFGARSFSPAAARAVRAHAWPGNVRELRNVIERAVVLSGGAAVIDVDHLVLAPMRAEPASSSTSPLRDHLSQVERERIEQALREASGNQSRAATILGISRRTLIERLDAYGLPRPRKRQGP